MEVFKWESKKGSKPPYYIKIKKSTIPGAGLGAFANCDIPSNVIIGEYLGKIYTKNEDPNSAYKFAVWDENDEDKLVKIIDGRYKKYSSWVRYVNTTQSDKEANCVFDQQNRRIFLRSKKNIPKGQELFAWYGEEYINELLEEFGKIYKPRISTKLTGYKCEK